MGYMDASPTSAEQPAPLPADVGARRAGAAAARVAKNSAWLIAQPLLLNAISLFATAYIARTLGPADYGRFVFALAFITLFMPFTNMGLRFIATRDLATSERAEASEYIAKMSTLRLVLAVASAGACVAFAALGHASNETAQVVYIASAIIVLQAVASTATDVFQAFESMRLVAQVQFVAGLALTIGSVVTLAAGLGLPGLMGSYVLGNLIGAALGLYYLYTRYARLRLAIDLGFWRSSLVRAAPLFVPSLVIQAGTRLGVVVLATVAGQAAVGAFGAANTLVEKLSIIPDGVCTALFPTLAAEYARSREEAGAIYRRVFRYFLLLALPIAVGTTVLAGPIIGIMYGKAYAGSTLVLVVLAWGLFASFFAQLLGWTVGAIGRERQGFVVPIAATVAYLGTAAALTPSLHELGLAVAGVVLSAVAYVLNRRIVRAHLVRSSMRRTDAARVLLASAIMAAVTYAVRSAPVWISIPVGAVTYGVALLAVRAVERSEVTALLDAIRARLRARTAASR